MLDWNAAELSLRDILDELRADAVAREAKVLLVVRDKQARSREVARATPTRRSPPRSPRCSCR